ncbi:MAG TPA: autotransporter domain-containing protein, partial [Rickettsia endosymbiont of Pyrocoelia pectoralis]|nr:autotransporter domain-containing protein [Rickettsia endosymbiont of Pyrocoelia pectoralis]
AQRLVDEAARVEAERLEAQRLVDEAARVEADRLEAQRLVDEAARVEAERLEAQRLVDEAARVEADRLEAQRLVDEAARVEAERLEAVEVARLEAERLAAVEADRREVARLAAERIAAEIAETTTMQTAVKKDEEIVNAMYNPTIVHNINQQSSNIISNRMMHTTLFKSAVAAGDKDEKVLDKGIWFAGIYGTNKQGVQKEFIGYKGRTSGGTVGFDVGFENVNDMLGIAYTKLDSKFKSTGNSLNTDVDSHIVALYGQKELPKNFMFQSMFAYNHNIVKSKINRLGTIASGKYKNNNYNFDGLLNYNYLFNSSISLIPNIGIKYGYSKDGQYQESNIGIQSLNVAAKKHNLWSSVLGGKIALAPQKIYKDISITPSLQASVENYFHNKSKKLHTKVKWKDKEINETVALPKQPKVGYNIGAGVLTEKGNVSILLEYNCHLQKKYQSHQGFVKLKINL